MKTDTLARRLRWEDADPRDEDGDIFPQEADLLQWELIARHGPLPLSYLYEFTKGARANYANLQKRYTRFYHAGWVSRPHQQYASFHARYSPLVYDLTAKARAYLDERLPKHGPFRAAPFVHQLMQACVGASIEMGAREAGLRYISREEILMHPKCPASTREASNPMAIPVVGRPDQKAVTPDDIFGLEYPGIGFRFFAVEVDRKTESIERRDPSQNAFGKKITGYLDIIKRQTFRSHLGVSNLHVLTLTTNAIHADNILDFVRRQNQPAFADRFAVASDASFGANWRVPKAVLYQLLTEPWATPVGKKHIGKP